VHRMRLDKVERVVLRPLDEPLRRYVVRPRFVGGPYPSATPVPVCSKTIRSALYCSVEPLRGIPFATISIFVFRGADVHRQPELIQIRWKATPCRRPCLGEKRTM
jgi:hypothetical protein